MNRENIEKLIDVLESLQEGQFDMRSWWGDKWRPLLEDGLDCGTPCCIGGWCTKLVASEMGTEKAMEIGVVGDWARRSREYLGISEEHFKVLTYPTNENNNERVSYHSALGNRVTHKRQAIKALRNILAGCRPREVWDGTSGRGRQAR